MSISSELQAHLLRLSQQVKNQQENMQVLAKDVQASRDMLESVLRHLTANQKPQFENDFIEKHIELNEKLEHNENQLTELDGRFSEHLRTLQNKVDIVTEQLSSFTNQMRHLSSSEEIENLSSKLTNLPTALVQKSYFDESFKDLEKRLTKFTRTQFKANSLSENQAKQIEQTLDTLRDVVTHRDAREESFFEEIRQEQENIYQDAKGELAITFLSILDGIEAALNSGEHFLEREKPSFDLPKDVADALMPQPPKSPDSDTKGKGFFARRTDEAYQRDYRKYKEEEKSFKSLVDLRNNLETLYDQSVRAIVDAEREQNEKALLGWLEGLRLVCERFINLLKQEDIVAIDPKGQAFDPHLHLGLEAVDSEDVTHDTVISVIRKGYRHGERILREAEVVVARAKRDLTVMEDSLDSELGKEHLDVLEPQGGTKDDLDYADSGIPSSGFASDQQSEVEKLNKTLDLESTFDAEYPVEDLVEDTTLEGSPKDFDRKQQLDSEQQSEITSSAELFEPNSEALVVEDSTPKELSGFAKEDIDSQRQDKLEDLVETLTPKLLIEGDASEFSVTEFDGEQSAVENEVVLESIPDPDFLIEDSKEIDVQNETEPLRSVPDSSENTYEGEPIQNTTNDQEVELDQLSLEERSTLMAEEAEQILRESFWEGPAGNTLEEVQEVPLTVPESAREQALEEISWQSSPEDARSSFSQEDSSIISEGEKQTADQEDSPKKNTLKTALELMEERFSLKEKVEIESENKE